MSDAIETYRGVVYPWQCDHMGHMNVMWYTGKFDEATWVFFAGLGITGSFMRERDRGMVAVKQETSYRAELLAGDVIVIRSRMLEVRERVLRFAHEMVNGATGEVAAVTEFTGVHLDRVARKACALPADVLVRARALLPPPP